MSAVPSFEEVIMVTTFSRRFDRKYDRVFFATMVGAILSAVFVGYARTYYLAGLARAPLPSAIVQVHAAAFSAFMILLVVQIGFVSTGRIALHRRLGLAGFALAAAMIVLGILAATDSLRRGFSPPGIDVLTFYIIPITDIVLFAIFILLANRARRVPVAHKRWVIVAAIAILDAAIARWPFAFVHQGHWLADLACYAFLAALAAYDVFSIGRVHRVTIIATIAIIVTQQLRVPIGMTPAWHAFAASIAR